MIMVHYKLIANTFSHLERPKNVNHDDRFVCEKKWNQKWREKNQYFDFLCFFSLPPDITALVAWG